MKHRQIHAVRANILTCFSADENAATEYRYFPEARGRTQYSLVLSLLLPEGGPESSASVGGCAAQVR